ncbi:hypothetical protein AMAG_11412 [Allomyces macrogynus ATCC 38327]|uniref:SET domain-containing protein n=1 Tax=Allomyces macrogynus (strain ATCC 38327) TaxID=578462 RepID=A0A0L0SWQ1_ALLM3|nr:hypothetical protein AMAG_11412 [Allomyces macrogynus ATCC 38327]|eukprot:KNE66937.1 hypothetical protein AMAG_11412 [Allomyces macrogynus ATCC 38327]
MSRRVTRASFRQQPTTPASVPAAPANPVEETRRATRSSATQIKTAASKSTAQQVGSVPAKDDAPSLAASTATLANLNKSASRLFDSSSATSLAPATADQSAGSKALVFSRADRYATLRVERIAARAAARPADGMMRLPTHFSTARKQPNDAGSAAPGGSTSTKQTKPSLDDGRDGDDSGSLMSVRSVMNGQQCDKGTPPSVGTGSSSPVPYFAEPPSDEASSTSTTPPASSSSSEQRATDRLMQLAEVALGLGIHMGAGDDGAMESTAQERTGLKQSTTSSSLSSVPTVESGPRKHAVDDVVMEDAHADSGTRQDKVPAAAGPDVAPMDVDTSPVASKANSVLSSVRSPVSSKASSVLTSVRSSPLSSVPDHLFNDAGLDSSFSSIDDSDEHDDPDHRPSSRRLPSIEVTRKDAVEIGAMTLVEFAKCTNMKLTITAYAMARCPEPSFRDLAAYDDVCTHILLDAMYLPFRVLKMDLADLAVANTTEATGKQPHHELPRQIVENPTEFPVPADDIAVVLRNVAEGKVSELDAVHMIIDQTAWLKKWLTGSVPIAQIAHFCRHMRRYVAMYTPAAGFDVVESRRYESAQPPAANKLRQAALVATRAYKPGEVLKLCSGHALALTPAEEDALQDAARDFSVLHSSRLNAFCLFLGPGRFANHDCEPNIDFVIRRRTLPPVYAAVIADVGDPPNTTTVPHASEIYMRATREIRAGEELTVSYGRHYFDRNNAACLCETCERTGRGQFAPERRSKAPDAASGDPAYASPAASSPLQSPPGSGGEEPAADASADSSVLRSPRMVRRAKVDARLHIRAEHKRDEPDMVGGLVVAPESDWDLDAPVQEGARLGSLRQFFHHVQDLGIGAKPRPAPRVPAVVIPPKVTCYHCPGADLTHDDPLNDGAARRGAGKKGVAKAKSGKKRGAEEDSEEARARRVAEDIARTRAQIAALREIPPEWQHLPSEIQDENGRSLNLNERNLLLCEDTGTWYPAVSLPVSDWVEEGFAPSPEHIAVRYLHARDLHVTGDMGMVMVEGDVHKRHRRIVNPLFSMRTLKPLVPAILSSLDEFFALVEHSPVSTPLPPSDAQRHRPARAMNYDFDAFNAHASLNERNLLLCEDTGTWYPAVSLPVSDWVEEGFAPSPEHIAVRYLHARDLQYGFVDFQHVYSVDQVLFEPEGIYLVASMQSPSSSSSSPASASSSSSSSTPRGREVRMLLSVNQDRALRCIAMPTRTKLLWRKWADEMHQPTTPASVPAAPANPVEETRRATRSSATQIKTAASKSTAQQVGSVPAKDDAPSLAASTATLANLNKSASRLFDSSSATSLAPATADQSAGSKALVFSRADRYATLRVERIAARAAARPADGMMRLPTHFSTARKQPNDAASDVAEPELASDMPTTRATRASKRRKLE